MARKKKINIIKIKPEIPKVRVPHMPEKVHQDKRKKPEKYKPKLEDYILEWEEEKSELSKKTYQNCNIMRYNEFSDTKEYPYIAYHFKIYYITYKNEI